MTPIRRPHRPGLSLAELLVVLVILALLAGMVYPTFANSRRDASQTAFACDLKVFVNALELHKFRTGDYPPAEAPGVCPANLQGYFDEGKWAQPTPIGGQWEWVRDECDVDAAVGVSFLDCDPDDVHNATFMTEVDAGFDDGRLATGMFRVIAEDRYGHVLRE